MARLKRKFSFKDKNQIWRIVLGSNDKLMIETRNSVTKEVFFDCFDLVSGKRLLNKIQLEDKFWIGIEEIYNDIIYFHGFEKPDMPDHKGIIAYDIYKKNILWENKDYRFHFVHEDSLYCFRPTFEGRLYYSLDSLTGELTEELGDNAAKINALKENKDKSKNWEEYLFPERYYPDRNENRKVDEIISSVTWDIEIVGNVEYNLFKNLLFFNVHNRLSDNSFINKFFVFDTQENKKIMAEVLNKDLKVFVPDSFFVYRDTLFILKGKNEVRLFDLIN